MGRLLTSTVAVIAAFTNPGAMSTASDEFSNSFDIPPRTNEEPFLPTNNLRRTAQHQNNIDAISPDEKIESMKRARAPFSPDELEKMKRERSERISERRKLAREKIAQLKPDPSQLEFVTMEEMQNLREKATETDPEFKKEENTWLRQLWGSSSSGSKTLVDPGASYDSWAQGYRMLGAFIDCDNDKDGDGSGDNDGSEDACSRWMMWAAYVNPNYNGGGRAEYFSGENDEMYYGGESNSATSKLDCHSPDTEWELLGVYRQEFYQFLEQISKHLWAIDDYEYAIALGGLAYMTDADCWYVGYSNSGDVLYAGIQPVSGGNFQMGLYTDSSCLILDSSSGMTFDDFGLTSDMYLGSQDDGTIDDDTLQTLYGYWQSSQEYTFTLMNEIYEEYKYCTLCMDYPTYQDGYFIGDSGTDDDDLINQCWKFHSHDSFYCTAECIALGDAQGTIVQVAYGSSMFGSSWDGSGGDGSSTSFDHVNKGYTNSDSTTKLQRLKANAYLTFNGILFIATFLAYSVARGARSESSSKEKRKSLLSRDDRSLRSGGSHSRKSRRSKSGNRKPSSGSRSRSKTSSRNKSAGSARSSRGGSSSRTKKSRNALSAQRIQTQ